MSPRGSIRLADLPAWLARRAQLLARVDVSAALGEARETVFQSVGEAFQQQRDPLTGEAWKPRKKPTGNWPLLRKTGALFQAATGGAGSWFRTTPSGLSFGVNRPSYAAFHQHGTARMPRRRFLALGQSARLRIRRLLAVAVARAARGG